MRTFFGLLVWVLGIGTLGMWAQGNHAPKIEAAIAEAALERAAASVHGLDIRVSGRDIRVNGVADSEEERKAIVAALRTVSGQRMVISQISILERATPYQFAGYKSEDGLAYEGHVPTSRSRLQFAARLGTAKLHKAAGMPDAQWPDVVFKAVSALKLLNAGDFELSGRTLTVTGVVNDPDAEAKVHASLGELPKGYSAKFALKTLDDGTPAEITLDFHAAEGARVSGKAPAGMATIHLASALKLSKLGGKIDSSIRGGKEQIYSRLEAIGPWLPLFERLTVKAGEASMKVEGELGAGTDIELVQAELDRAFGQSAAIELSDAESKAADGAERVNVATGQHEVFRNGYWLPAVDFTVSREACAAGTEEILKHEDIDFVDGSKRLGAKTAPILNKLAATLHHCLADSSLFVEIGGHTYSQS